MSGDERSLTHQINGSALSSIVVLNTINRAKSRGICKSIGKHPPSGFTPLFL